MPRLLLIAALFLAACNTPHPAYFKAEKRSVVVERSKVDVYAFSDAAQAIITTSTRRLSHDDAERIARTAIARTTGCDKIKVTKRSDKSVLTAKLGCG